MPRTSRLTDALRGRGKALVFAGAAAALAGVGTASAATATSATVTPATVTPATVSAATQPASVGGAAVSALGAAASGGQGTVQLDPAAAPAPFGTASPRSVPAHQPALRTLVTAGSTTRAPATQLKPPRPYEIYDSVTPSAIPAHHQVATYATGGYAVSPSQVAGRGNVLWIDTRGTDPKAAALDVEPGDATPSVAANWAWHKLHAADNSVAIIYTMRSEWAATKAAVNTLPGHMRSHIRWWIADPTGYNHVVPGASATQWYWGSNYDITTANPGFR